MGDFADSVATASDVELLALSPARLSPAPPTGEQLLEANLYAVCELVAGRAARASSARQYASIYTLFCDALRDELGPAPRRRRCDRARPRLAEDGLVVKDGRGWRPNDAA